MELFSHLVNLAWCTSDGTQSYDCSETATTSDQVPESGITVSYMDTPEVSVLAFVDEIDSISW